MKQQSKKIAKRSAETSPPDLRRIPMDEWGRDHWSTLAYIETRCVDYKGRIDIRNMRCNGVRHPGLAHLAVTFDQFEHPSILHGGKTEPEHDDWDCLYDMEAVGLLVDNGTGINALVALTETGWAMAHRLRRYRAEGGNYQDFVA